jgi:prepilin-type N-terminal cleavage/methylation domain-containing protein
MKIGFTLIEMVVVVSVLAVIMVTISSLLINSFKARNKINVSDVLEQNGSYVLSEVRNDFLNSDGKNADCGDGTQLTLISRLDGNQTVIQCNEGADIASMSATMTVKLNHGVSVSNCVQFVSCDTDADGNVTAINVGFTLSAGTAEAGVENSGSRSFQTKVAARN